MTRTTQAALSLVALACRNDFVPPPLVADPVPFRQVVIDSAPASGRDCCLDILAVGDLSGDGQPDLMVGAQLADSGALAWYEYPSWRRHAIADGEFTTDGQLADLDGDGDLDIVVGTEQHGLFWFENPAPALDRPWARHAVGGTYWHDVEVADLDGDGRPEIVTCDKRQIVVWRGSGDSWTASLLLEHLGEGLAVGDLNGDARPDIGFGQGWLRNAAGDSGSEWTVEWIDRDWPADTRVRFADVNRDGALDVVLSASEGVGRLSWFEERSDTSGSRWIEHGIESGELEGAHSLQVGDLDGDGRPDVLVAEMHTSARKRILAYLQDADGWTRQVLGSEGSHNMRLVDMGSDGDLDVVGKNYAGPDRRLRLWENLRSDLLGSLSSRTWDYTDPSWTYLTPDTNRPATQFGKTGLVVSRLDGDLLPDLVVGALAYRNPGGTLEGAWARSALPESLDVHFALDVDGDAAPDLIAAVGGSLVWLEAADSDLGSWIATPVATIPEGRTQGTTIGRLWGPGPQLVFTRATSLLAVSVPQAPDRVPWPTRTLSERVQEEGVQVVDVNADGAPDVVAIDSDGQRVLWFENPGREDGSWLPRVIGLSTTGPWTWLDRLAVADVDGDGRLDVIATEESQDWAYNCHIYWFRAPSDPRAETWGARVIGTLRSANSLDVADLDGDGRPDVLTAEHTDQREGTVAPNTLTVAFLNRDLGERWLPRPIHIGAVSSHLGMRAVDLDGDGDLDIVSMGWHEYSRLHVWRQTGGVTTAGRE